MSWAYVRVFVQPHVFCEVRGRRREVRSGQLDEGCFIGLAEREVVLELRADVAHVALADGFATSRAGSVGRKHQHLRLEGLELLERVEEVLGQVFLGDLAFLGEVGAADVAQEERVAREDAEGFPGLLQHEAGALHGVAGRVQTPDLVAAQAETLLVLHHLGLEGRVGERPKDDFCAGLLGQVEEAGDEVCVVVRLDDVLERSFLLRDDVEVVFGVSQRVQHCDFVPCDDDVREVRETGGLYLQDFEVGLFDDRGRQHYAIFNLALEG